MTGPRGARIAYYVGWCSIFCAVCIGVASLVAIIQFVKEQNTIDRSASVPACTTPARNTSQIGEG